MRRYCSINTLLFKTVQVLLFKPSIIILASLFFAACSSNDTEQKDVKSKVKDAQPKDSIVTIDTSTQSPDALTTEQMVLEIRNEFQRINALSLNRKEYKFFCDADGTVSYYSQNGKVLKIAIDWGFVGHGSTTTEYYYKEDQLIFIYETFIGGPSNGSDTKTEYRTYVYENKAVKYMENGDVRQCKTCEYNKSSRAYKVLGAFGTEKIEAALCK